MIARIPQAGSNRPVNLLTPIAAALRVFARFAIRRYYKTIEISGRERIPATGPAVFVANHPNSMFDPAVVGITVVRPVHFVSKAPLFDIPIFGDLMRALGMIPAFRGRDDMTQVSRNTGSLEDAASYLARGEAVGIFPEGMSHDAPRVELVRGGAARMAVAAARAGAKVQIVPLGLNYECKEQFKSDIWVRVGEPIDVAAELASLGEDDRKAARELTNEVDRRLKAVVVHLDEAEWAGFLPDLEVLLPPPAEYASVPGAKLRQRKRIADAMNHFLAEDRPRAEAMAAEIESHRAALAAEGLEIRSDVVRLHGRKLFARLARQFVFLAISLFPAVAGIAHHVVPVAFIRGLMLITNKRAKDVIALYRILYALPILVPWYALVWWWLAGVSEPWIATLWTALMPFAGLRALWFLRAARTTIPTLWHELRLLSNRRRLHELRRAHIELRHRLRLLAADYAKISAREETFRAV